MTINVPYLEIQLVFQGLRDELASISIKLNWSRDPEI